MSTELLRYQEPWEAVAALADDAAENEAKERDFTAMSTLIRWELTAAEIGPSANLGTAF